MWITFFGFLSLLPTHPIFHMPSFKRNKRFCDPGVHFPFRVALVWHSSLPPAPPLLSQRSTGDRICPSRCADCREQRQSAGALSGVITEQMNNIPWGRAGLTRSQRRDRTNPGRGCAAGGAGRHPVREREPLLPVGHLLPGSSLPSQSSTTRTAEVSEINRLQRNYAIYTSWSLLSSSSSILYITVKTS